MSLTELVGTLRAPFDLLLSEVGGQVNQVASNRILEYQVSSLERCLFVKTILHRVKPVNLLEIYYRQGIKTLNSDKDPWVFNTVKELLEKERYITILGSAGSGKSTMLKYIFVKAIEEQDKIPVLIKLRHLSNYQESFEAFVFNRVFKLFNLGVNDNVIKKMLESDRFVFLLDGFDELVSSQRQRLTTELDQFVQKYSLNSFIVTSRPFVDIELLPLFANYEISSLSNEDIKKYIKKQLPAEEEELVEKIIESIETVQSSPLNEFLSNPLLLSMFILTFQSNSSIPEEKNIFYSQVIDVLFHTHDSLSKLGYERQRESNIPRSTFDKVMSMFCFISLFEEEILFTRDYCNEKFDFIKSKLQEVKFDNDKLIDDLLSALCIWTKEGYEYTFVHKSLQEYFAALFISKLEPKAKKKVFEKVFARLTNVKVHSDTDRRLDFTLFNFVSLLRELNEKAVTEEIVIPFLDFFVEEVMNKFDGDKSERAFAFVNSTFIIGNMIHLLGMERGLEVGTELFSIWGESISNIESVKNNGDGTFDLKIEPDYMPRCEKIFQAEIDRLKTTLQTKINIENDIVDLF
ncbi:MAG: NACHT domain-containing protein [Lewinella sp.]|uniref:NACHT domain-containing protein n=1 Tax=Lewinella sp. TaxID=2004506 RepID=UPI003D6C624B